MLNLVTIERVNRVTTIEGADNIEVVNVLAKDVVIKKGMVKEGDLCLYIRPGTLIPTSIGFNFLEKFTKRFQFCGDTLEGHLVKRVKIKGVESNGLVIPLKHMFRKMRKMFRPYTKYACNGHTMSKKEYIPQVGDDLSILFQALPYNNVKTSSCNECRIIGTYNPYNGYYRYVDEG